MKKICKNIVLPINLWATPDLTIQEKWVLLCIDSYSDNIGTTIGTTLIASDTNIPVKEVKSILKSLQEKGAISINIGESGEKLIKAFLYKERYIADPSNVTIGDKPDDAAPLPYDEIQKKWNEICFMLPKIERFTPRRKQKTRACLKGANATTEDLYKVFRLAATSSFLNGSKTDWKCTYDWIIKSPDNFQKVFEGNYHSRDYNERVAYESIISGSDIKTHNSSDVFYR